jgi:hypothetical protein
MTGSVLAPTRTPESKTVSRGILTVRIDYSFDSEMVPNRANGRRRESSSLHTPVSDYRGLAFPFAHIPDGFVTLVIPTDETE